MEYMNNFGGVFLISVTACFATCRGCTRGFSRVVAYIVADGAAVSVGKSSGSAEGGGAMYTSFSGGNSSMSEKLRPGVTAVLLSSIIGSTAIPGAVCSLG
jgi:hypothetical protein